MINKNLIGTRQQTKKIEIPEWDATLYIKKLTGKDFKVLLSNNSNNENIDEGVDTLITIIILALVEEDGSKVFSELDRDKLMSENFEILNRIGTEIKDFSLPNVQKIKKK